MSTPQDPRTWVALAYRLLTNWRSLMLFLIALAVVAVIAGAMVHLLRMSTVEVGPVIFQRQPAAPSSTAVTGPLRTTGPAA